MSTKLQVFVLVEMTLNASLVQSLLVKVAWTLTHSSKSHAEMIQSDFCSLSWDSALFSLSTSVAAS